MKSTTCTIACLAIWLGFAGYPFCSANDRPNFIVIMSDDLSALELSCYGHPTQQTSHLDRLAETGVKFETAYACPVCHPTRFMIMTGQYGSRNGVYNFPGRRGGPPVADQGSDDITSHVTFGPLLKAQGYATALAGKWQLSGQPPTLIHECGFDEYCCWAYRAYYSEGEARRANRAGINFRSRYWHPSIIRDGRWVPTTEDDYGPDMFANFIVDFIERQRDEPFFVYYPMVLTHNQWNPTPDTIETSGKWCRHLPRMEYMDCIVCIVSTDELGCARKRSFSSPPITERRWRQGPTTELEPASP